MTRPLPSRPLLRSRPWAALAGAALLCWLGGCVSVPELAPFTTDGCSWFPDRDRAKGQDWTCCCVAHDVAYWRGGTWVERVEADQALRQCVRARTGDEALAALMHAGVRAGGSPHLPTSFRWAYGWGRTGRTYEPLDEDERAHADALLAQSVAARAAQCAAPAPTAPASAPAR